MSKIENSDSTHNIIDRTRKGAFFTPLKLVDKAYEYINKNLNDNWQDDYYVWDMCCGTGNLLRPHKNLKNVFMSTLDQRDIDLMKESNLFNDATIFQYDYLNDDISNDGTIDYNISGKVPEELREIIRKSKLGEVKLLILINPPYGEAGDTKGKNSKAGISNTKIKECFKEEYGGQATNEIAHHFYIRIQKELKGYLCLFDKIKYFQAPSLIKFQEKWTYRLYDGFLVHSKAFEDLKGDFPISFILWDLNKIENLKDSYELACYDKKVEYINNKIILRKLDRGLLSHWVDRPKSNGELAVPVTSSARIYEGEIRLDKKSDNYLGYFLSLGNKINCNNYTSLYSSVYGGGHGIYITPSNLLKLPVFSQ